MENDQNTDPYEAVLADLRAQKERIDSTIALLESLRASGIPATVKRVTATGEASKSKGENRPDLGPGAFLGMTIHDATKRLLASQRRQMQTAEIVTELERGGLVLTSADKINTVGSVLLRRFNTVGDIVRVARGLWGLQEWYPGRKFPGSKSKNGDVSKGEDAEQDEAEGGNKDSTEPSKPTGGAADWVAARPPQTSGDD